MVLLYRNEDYKQIVEGVELKSQVNKFAMPQHVKQFPKTKKGPARISHQGRPTTITSWGDRAPNRPMAICRIILGGTKPKAGFSVQGSEVLEPKLKGSGVKLSEPSLG